MRGSDESLGSEHFRQRELSRISPNLARELDARGAVIQNQVRLSVAIYFLWNNIVVARSLRKCLEVESAVALAGSKGRVSGVAVINDEVRFAIAGVVRPPDRCESCAEREGFEFEPAYCY